MTIRPVDEHGDILPVLTSSDAVKGADAAALLVTERLDLYAGDWWENPSRGNGILKMLQDSRLAEADRQALGNCLTTYIRETDGVRDVRDVALSVVGRRFSFSCTVVTEFGNANISYLI